MALRTKTIEYVFPTQTGNISGNIAYEFPGTTVWIPETGSRSFHSVELEVFSRDNHAAAQNISGTLLGVKLGTSGYFLRQVTDVITNSAEDQSYLFCHNATPYFNSSFGTGTFNTGAVLVQFSGTSQNQANVHAKLKITYNYEDVAATTRIKTIRIPIESRKSTLTTTEVPLNSGRQIPALFNGYLPETGITKRQVWLELFGHEASSFVSPMRAFYRLDNGSGGPLSTGPSGNFLSRFSVLNSSCWYKGVVDLTSLHAFTGVSTLFVGLTGAGNTALSNLGGMLCATYEYDHSSSTGIYNSIFLDGPVDYGLMGSTNEISGTTHSSEFYIEESGISLKESALLAYYNTPAAFTFFIGAGNQSGIFYPVVLGGLSCGQQSVVHRIDGSGNTSTPFGTLVRGRNVINTKWFSNSLTNGNGLTSQILLNYISNKHPSGDGVHNHSIYSNIAEYDADTLDRIIINKTGAMPVELNYYINGVQLYCPYMTSADVQFPMNINVSLTGLEGANNIGSGFTPAYYGNIVGTVENQLNTINASMSPFARFANYPKQVNHINQMSPLAISGVRNWRVQNYTSVRSSLGMWTTYHSIFYPINSTITNTTGGNVQYIMVDNLTDQVLFTGGRVGDGAINENWYDNTRPIYIIAKQGGSNRGLSISQGVDSGNFNISFGGGSVVNNICRTIVHPGMQGGLRG